MPLNLNQRVPSSSPGNLLSKTSRPKGPFVAYFSRLLIAIYCVSTRTRSPDALFARLSPASKIPFLTTGEGSSGPVVSGGDFGGPVSGSRSSPQAGSDRRGRYIRDQSEPKTRVHRKVSGQLVRVSLAAVTSMRTINDTNNSRAGTRDDAGTANWDPSNNDTNGNQSRPGDSSRLEHCRAEWLRSTGSSRRRAKRTCACNSSSKRLPEYLNVTTIPLVPLVTFARGPLHARCPPLGS
jgi:hypothetical protein